MPDNDDDDSVPALDEDHPLVLSHAQTRRALAHALVAAKQADEDAARGLLPVVVHDATVH